MFTDHPECPLSSDTSCKFLFTEIWCSAAYAQCSRNGRERPGNYPNGSSGFSVHVNTCSCHPIVVESSCYVTYIPEPTIKPSNSQIVATTNVCLGSFSTPLLIFQSSQQMLVCSYDSTLQCSLLFFKPDYSSFGVRSSCIKKQWQWSNLETTLLKHTKLTLAVVLRLLIKQKKE